MKISYRIKKSILNIIESTKEIKQKKINFQNMYFYVKYQMFNKFYKFVIGDFELLGDVVSSYDNYKEIINRIREGIYNL